VSLTLATGMPWWFVAIVHFMEGGGKFTKHLHNGDPLTARTVNVPKGRPVMGKAPFSWEESAIDAINYMEGQNKILEGIKRQVGSGICLLKFEAYNGMGYRTKGINSPYLYSATLSFTPLANMLRITNSTPTLVSKQPGVIPLMKALGV
jgi:lysozyme family protein